MSRNKILLIVAFAIVAAGLLYYFFFLSKDAGAGISETPVVASDAELSFINLVSQLDPITFDTSLLSDPRFISRQDIRTVVVPETAGRKDPFAPLGR